jgi:hypothetical protein
MEKLFLSAKHAKGREENPGRKRLGAGSGCAAVQGYLEQDSALLRALYALQGIRG